jgi:hypothetical protein
MNVKTIRFIILILCIACGSFAESTKSQSITVDCNKNASINGALADNSEELIIEIRGICSEDVVVQRSNVTLHGIDPNTDGIHGVTTQNISGQSVLRVRNAMNVRIENLQIAQGVRNGLGVDASTNTNVVNCRFLNNGSAGASFGGGGTGSVSNSYFSGNVIGIAGFDGGAFSCNNCTITSPQAIGVFNTWAAASIGGSRLAITNSNLTGFAALVANSAGAQLNASNSTINGGINVESNSLMHLNSVNQTGNPRGYNFAWVDSTLRINGSNLTGEMYVQEFSKFLIMGSSTYNSDIYCETESDTFCENPGNISGGVDSCNSCVQE